MDTYSLNKKGNLESKALISFLQNTASIRIIIYKDFQNDIIYKDYMRKY